MVKSSTKHKQADKIMLPLASDETFDRLESKVLVNKVVIICMPTNQNIPLTIYHANIRRSRQFCEQTTN